MIPAAPENKAIPAPDYRPVGFNGTSYGEPHASPAPPRLRSWHAFNLNGAIRFRPTAKGMKIWREHWGETRSAVGGPYSLKVDADGWATEQLWQVMQVFGPHFGLGLESPIEMGIELGRWT